MHALRGQDSTSVDGLIFATTTAPFAEKSSAAFIADCIGLPPEARVLDTQGSLRSGTAALFTAWDWISSGACSRVLVVAADTRLAKPGNPDEMLFGHAGIAVLLGDAATGIAELRERTAISSSRPDMWRLAGDRFPSYADQRFARKISYSDVVLRVLETLLESTGWKPADISKVTLYSPDVKSGSGVLKSLGFDLKTQYFDPASYRIGLTGSAHSLLMLCAAMERSTADDRLLAVGYGDGADACAIVMKTAPAEGEFSRLAKSSYEIPYNQFLAEHGLHAGAEKMASGFTSEIMAERNRDPWLHLLAQRCGACGSVVTLPLPMCPHCREQGRLESFALQRTGTVFAITHEHYYPTPVPPLGMASVDLDGGGRLTLQVADENASLEIGDRVELVFRRLHDAGNQPNYFWKCRSIEVKGGGNG
jgi:uncharacterized OB-fold protein/3-oxoacyl-[acyl-carrier-protein] synthase III